jgi:hypothetical protein
MRGGLLGVIVSDFLIKYLNKPGDNIFLILVLFFHCGCIPIFPLSVGAVFRFCLYFFEKRLSFPHSHRKFFVQRKASGRKKKPLKEKETSFLCGKGMTDRQEGTGDYCSLAPEKVFPDKPKIPVTPRFLPVLSFLRLICFMIRREVIRLRKFLLQNSRVLKKNSVIFGVQDRSGKFSPWSWLTLYELERRRR